MKPMKEYLSLLPPHWVSVAGYTETLSQRFLGGAGVPGGWMRLLKPSIPLEPLLAGIMRQHTTPKDREILGHTEKRLSLPTALVFWMLCANLPPESQSPCRSLDIDA